MNCVSPGGTTSNDIFSSIVLPTGVTTNGVNNNFGELLGASISGFVYADDDNDGVTDNDDDCPGTAPATQVADDMKAILKITQQTTTSTKETAVSIGQLAELAVQRPSERGLIGGVDVLAHQPTEGERQVA